MKKVFGLILAVCLLASMFCIAVFATEAPESDVVLRVGALKKDGTIIMIEDFKNHAEGWSAAMTLADNTKEMKKNDYDRIIVDIYADWIAVDGEFSNEGKGFKWETIYFEEGVRMTVNLNGHTINRGLDDWMYNGEVMYIDEEADVIINDGTITGGFSCNGAGGIHIMDDANVTLNNVKVVGNRVEDDDGAGIAIYDGATLMMNGGSISDNVANLTLTALLFGRETANGAGLYAEDSTVILDNVTIQNNQSMRLNNEGSAIFATDSDVTLNNCSVIGNGIINENAGWNGAMSVIYTDDGHLTIKNTRFTGNGCVTNGTSSTGLIVAHGDLSIESCLFSENSACYMIHLYGHKMNVLDTSFVENYANVFYGYGESNKVGTFVNCTFGNNAGSSWEGFYSFKFGFEHSYLTFTDCYFGNSTFNDRSRVTFENAGRALAGSIFSQNSFVTIVSFVALIVSIASILINTKAKLNKQPVIAKETDEEE